MEQNIQELLRLVSPVITGIYDIEGVRALVLGGSHCIGLNTESSDIDLCIYYDDDLDLNRLNSFFASIDDKHRTDIILPPYSWGKNLNSGGVCLFQGNVIDFSLREINHVKKHINDCINGKLYISYQSGYPWGFCNSFFVGEIRYCKVIFDPLKQIEHLKKIVHSQWNQLLKNVQKTFLEEACYQCACAIRQVKGQDEYYLDAEYRTSIFLMLNVLAAECGLVYFHNKHIFQRIQKEDYTKDKKYYYRAKKIYSLCIEPRTFQEKYFLLAQCIIEEGKWINDLQSNEFYKNLLFLLQLRC